MMCGGTSCFVDVCYLRADKKSFSFGHCALMLRILQLVLRGRDVIPDCALSSCSAFSFKACAIDMTHVPPFRSETVLHYHFSVDSLNTLCDDLLMMIFGLQIKIPSLVSSCVRA